MRRVPFSRSAPGGVTASRRLTGAPLPEGKGKIPNVTETGLAVWTESEIAFALSTGLTPSGELPGGPMAAAARNLGQVPETDVAAIAHYLKTFNPGGGA